MTTAWIPTNFDEACKRNVGRGSSTCAGAKREQMALFECLRQRSQPERATSCLQTQGTKPLIFARGFDLVSRGAEDAGIVKKRSLDSARTQDRAQLIGNSSQPPMRQKTLSACVFPPMPCRLLNIVQRSED